MIRWFKISKAGDNSQQRSATARTQRKEGLGLVCRLQDPRASKVAAASVKCAPAAGSCSAPGFTVLPTHAAEGKRRRHASRGPLARQARHGGFRSSGVPSWGPYYKGILLFWGDSIWGSLTFVKPPT